jgi:hypothetical protein
VNNTESKVGANRGIRKAQFHFNPPVFQPSRLLILGLILLATWLRFWQLDTTPPGLWFDEAYYAMDAVWIRETNTWPVFLLGNNGREPMFSYLVALAITFLGEKIYTSRWVAALVGIVAIPLIYRWVTMIFKGERHAHWLALISAAGLVTSFWAVGMNRTGYRANLLPLFVLLVSYFFWRGWQTRRWSFYLIAGVLLGLAQYTYLSARLLPLAFALFVCLQTWLTEKQEQASSRAAWKGLFIMAGISALVAAPLLLFFVDYPEVFWGRADDVAFRINWTLAGLKALGLHWFTAIRVFIDGQDPNLRHHLPARPVFDWFNTMGFWPGLIVASRRYRRPQYLFLLILLFSLWLPAPLSEPAFHTLRLSGILPAYYVLVALGIFNFICWLGTRLFLFFPPCRLSTASLHSGFVALAAILLFSGGLTFYDYFYRWAKDPQVYQAFDGPVVDLAHELISSQAKINLIIPFYLYTHASMRYLLHDSYTEKVILPQDVLTSLRQQKETIIVIPEYPPDDHEPPAFVWLNKEEAKQGVAYVSEVRRGLTINDLGAELIDSIKGKRGNIIAYQYKIETKTALTLFPQQLPSKKAAFIWADNLILSGYNFAPNPIRAGMSSTLFLSWGILGYTGLEEKMFIQLLDNQGSPIGQAEPAPISRKMYRWRKDALILEQYPLNFATNLKAGLYFVRLGFFNPKTAQRLQAYNPAKQPVGDEVILGPLYVNNESINPVIPQFPIQGMLGDAIELLGYSIPLAAAGTPATEIKLYWKAHKPVNQDYTAFVQLLDQQNRVIAQHDAQPLAGLYPTSRWQPGDIISERFVLPVAEREFFSASRLVTGMYDLSTGARLPTYNTQDEPLLDGLIELMKKR